MYVYLSSFGGFNISLLSVVVPCYNEEHSVLKFYREFRRIYDEVLSYDFDLDYELIFVDDGSEDNTLDSIKELAGHDDFVKYISFSRNFGKESALFAGLENSHGDYLVVMDADLQDPPNLLPEMFRLILTGDYDCIATRRVSRKGEPKLRSFFARAFYSLINSISDLEFVDGARDYRLMTRQVADAILELNEYHRFSKGIFNWVGFKTRWVEYENVQRVDDESSWSFWSLFRYSIEGIVAFSTLPLALSTFLGMIFSIFAFLLIIFIVIKKSLYGDPVQGWASTICVILLLGGIQLFTIGILGKYLDKTYIESKKRPIYLTRETNIEE